MRQPKKPTRRSIFKELMEGVSAMRAHREGRIAVRARRVRISGRHRTHRRVLITCLHPGIQADRAVREKAKLL